MEANKNRFNDKELEEFRQIINEKLDKARKDLDFLGDQIKEINESGEGAKLGDWEEGTQTSEIEYLAEMAARQQQFIKHLENALIRISNKTYGICTVTGKLIDKERLKLVPHATKSIIGKNQENKQV